MITEFRNVALSIARDLSDTATIDATAQPKLAAAISNYAKAWASKDVDQIVALHTEDSTFTVHVSGRKAAVGRDAIAAQFQKILHDNPQYESTARTTAYGPDVVVIEYSFKMQSPVPIDSGEYNTTPSNRMVFDVDAIDIIHFKNGLISVKHTYVDTRAIHDHGVHARRVA
jgi:uncharacterized protein (TIGR02246 family)